MERYRVSPYSVRMRENADQNNSEYGQFSRSGTCERGIAKKKPKLRKKQIITIPKFLER